MTDRKFQKKLKKIEKQGERYKKEYELKAAYAKYVPEKKKKKVSNVMLTISVIAIVGYVVASFILQFQTSVEISSTISTLWFAFWTVEIFALAGIKLSKNKHGINSVVSNIVDEHVSENEQTNEEDYGEDVAG